MLKGLLTGTGLLFLLVSAGCQGSKQARRNNAARSVSVEAARATKPPAATPSPPPQAVIYTARSEAALEAIYRGASQAANAAPHSTPPREYAPMPQAPLRVGAGWDVPLKRRWRYIVVHHSASETGSAAIFDKWHKARGWDGLGYHFVIGNGSASGDGEVEVGYRWRRQLRGAHAGKAEYNEHGIGIALVGNFQHSRPSPRQMASLTSLVRFLQKKCGIPASRVIGHRDVPGKSTECPGRHFSLPAFRKRLARAGPAPQRRHEPPSRAKALFANSTALP